MDKNKIEIGDIVNVFFSVSSALFRHTILATPQDTGDSWKLRNETGGIVYVQIFEQMILKVKRR